MPPPTFLLVPQGRTGWLLSQTTETPSQSHPDPCSSCFYPRAPLPTGPQSPESLYQLSPVCLSSTKVTFTFLAFPGPAAISANASTNTSIPKTQLYYSGSSPDQAELISNPQILRREDISAREVNRPGTVASAGGEMGLWEGSQGR